MKKMFKSVKNIFFVQADVQGYGWRASYVLSALPGFIVGILLATTVKDPFTGYTTAAGSRYSQRLWIEAVMSWPHWKAKNAYLERS